jgi:DMSO/TMAO reductase YedYZ heme-binding membrane subunit
VKSDPTFWVLARASGLTAYALLTASVLMGLLVKARPFRSLKPAAVTDLHRFVSTLAIGAVLVHGAALVLDSAVPISVQALVVPGLASYRPFWTGLGVVAAELMVLVIASFSLRKRIGTRNWRRLHWATYATFAAAAIHGIATGTDTSHPWALGLYGATIGAVVAATAYRTLTRPPRRARPASPSTPPTRGGTVHEHLPHRDRPVSV